MEEDEIKQRRFFAVRFEDDIPKNGKGMFIPYLPKKPLPLALPSARGLSLYRKNRALLIVPTFVGIFCFVFGMSFVSKITLPSVMTANVSNIDSDIDVLPLNYGVQVAVSRPNVFSETRDALIEKAETFIDIDLNTKIIRFFDNGVLTLSAPIISKGEVGSLWQTQAGLYTVENKQENYFSNIGQIYLPWAIVFQGNLMIHGSPITSEGQLVEDNFAQGGIRIDNAIAKSLYEAIDKGENVLVYETPLHNEYFLYEPKIPELKTPHYLIADIKSNTVLASSDLEAIAPIASVTKLMTALVTVEHINLDKTIYASEPTFIQELIPRLGELSQVSVYNLLQLLLVESSNEASEMIAVQLGRDEFIRLMNEKAKSLGMLNTHFVDPSGLASENTSSPADLLRLTEYLYTNHSFIFDITASKFNNKATVNDFSDLRNYNQVENLTNFIGGKVGETTIAKQTSVTLHKISVKEEERVLAIIILGSENRNDDVKQLLLYVEERFGESQKVQH